MNLFFIYFGCFFSVLGIVSGAFEEEEEESLIIGGVDTDIANVPYQAGLIIKKHYFCGGAILSHRFVVTGAHCVEFFTQRHRSNDNLFVRVGSNFTDKDGNLVKVKDSTCHPEFNFDTYDYDICILELEKPLRFNKNVKSIKLVSEEPEGGELGIIAGWGTLSESGKNPEHLQSVMVPLTNKTYCHEAYKVVSPISERMICAGVEGKDSCQGDSGGGLVINNKLVGIISTGFGCGVKGFPGVYTSIGHPEIRKFIKEVTNL